MQWWECAVVWIFILLISLFMTVSGSVCLLQQNSSMCLWQLEYSGPLVIVGFATLLPALAALYAQFMDYQRMHRKNDKYELDRLLPTLQKDSIEYDAEFDYCRSQLFTYLYASHFLAAWGDRMWQFAVPILFMEIFVDTLMPSAVFSLFTYASCLIVMPSIGQYLDHCHRLKTMMWSIVLENGIIVCSSMLLAGVMHFTNADGKHLPELTWSLGGVCAVIMVCGGIGQVLNNVQTLAIERDWVVVMAESLPKEKMKSIEDDRRFGESASKKVLLTQFNTTLRRIDLSCKVLSPAAFGVIMQYSGGDPTVRAAIGAMVVAVWNLLSFPIELIMTYQMYSFVPQLKRDPTHLKNTDKNNSFFASMETYKTHWRMYYNHPVFLASFGFCALYMSVLTGGTLNTGYLKWRDVSDAVLGASRGIGAVAGLIGTFLFPILLKNLRSVEKVYVCSTWLFFASLCPLIAVFIILGQTVASDYTMMAVTIFSRGFLWSADLAETQIMQEMVQAENRVTINAMQTSTSQLFFVIIQLFGIFCSNPRDFIYLVIASISAVFFSACASSVFLHKVSNK